MNKLAAISLGAFLSIGQVQAQVNEVAFTTNAVIETSGNTHDVFGRIQLVLREFEEKTRGTNINMLNELEKFLGEKGFENVYSFCSSTKEATYSGILIGESFKIIYVDKEFKIEPI